MGVIKRTTAECVALAANINEWPLSKAIAATFAFPLLRIHVKHFSDGELKLRCPELGLVKGRDALIFAPQFVLPADSIAALAFLAQLLRQAQARRIIAVIPYVPFSRQECSPFAPEMPGPLQLVISYLKLAGITDIVTVWFHAVDAIASLALPVTTVSAARFIADKIVEYKLHEKNPWLVAPDRGAASRVKEIAHLLGLRYLIFEKQRNHEGEVSNLHLSMPPPGQKGSAIIIDDIIATGSTALYTCRELMRYGFTDIYGWFVHPVLSGQAQEKLERSNFIQIFVTNTRIIPPLEYNAFTGSKICVQNIQPLLEHGIRTALEQRDIRYGRMYAK